MADDVREPGDENQINIGPNSQLGQVAAGRNVVQIGALQIQLPPAQIPMPHAIGPPPADFTGRSEETRTLLAEIDRAGGAAISGVVGFGGVGKTALARQVAHLLKDRYPDGKIEIDLQGTKTPLSPTEAMRALLRPLLPAEQKLPYAQNEVTQLYRGVWEGKRALVLLDDASDAAQVRPLLPLPGCAVIVTSRTYFKLQGLTPLRLDVFSHADAGAFLLKLCPRVGEHAGLLAELCGRLPLALEIAGSFLAERDQTDVGGYAVHLKERRLPLLKRLGDQEFDVEAVFSETYEHLDVSEQVAWRVLGVFPATFDANAAEYVLGLELGKGSDVLEELRRYSLVQWGQGRYSLHDLLRDYAREKILAQERALADKRHAEFYLGVAGEADRLYKEGGAMTSQGRDLFEQELVNLRAGRAWAAGRKDVDAARLSNEFPASALYLMDLRLGAHERIEWLEDAVAAARELGLRMAEGNHLINLGRAYSDLGEIVKSIEYFQQALAILREIGSRGGESASFGSLGNAHLVLGDVRMAIGYYEQALAIAREIGDRRREGNQMGSLGNGYSNLGEFRKSIEYFEQALAIHREISDRRGEGNDLGNLGNGYYSLGDLRKGIEHHEQALAIHREISDRRGEGNDLGNLAYAYRELGDATKASEYYEQARAIAREVGDRRREGIWIADLGDAYRGQGDAAKAIEYFEQALAIHREIGYRRGEGDDLGRLGNAYRDLGNPAKAVEYFERALAIHREIGDRQGEGAHLSNLGSAHRDLNQNDQARDNWRAALAIFEAIEDPRAEMIKGLLTEIDEMPKT